MKALILLHCILNGFIFLTPVLGCPPSGCTADDCPEPYTLRECEDLLATNECLSNPCQNGANCEDLFDEYECVCRRGFTGKQCQNDVEAPTITCPPNQAYHLKDATTKVVHWDPPTVSDNAGNATVTISDSRHRSGSTFLMGETVIHYTATDASGNMNTCSFTILLDRAQECENSPCQNGASCEVLFEEITCLCTRGFNGDRCEHDIEPPAIICPDDVFAETKSKSAKVTWHMPTTSDNSNKPPSISPTHKSGDVFSVGTTTVTISVSDDANNINQCSFRVIVERMIDAASFTSNNKGNGKLLTIGLPIILICVLAILVALACFIYRRIRKPSDDIGGIAVAADVSSSGVSSKNPISFFNQDFDLGPPPAYELAE